MSTSRFWVSRLKKLSDLNIGTQLRIGLGAVFLLVVILGAESWIQTESLWQETKNLYEHPVSVRTALGEAKGEIVSMQRGMKDLMLTANDRERESIIQEIDAHEEAAMRQFDILYANYLGPISDIDEAHVLFVKWKSIRSETIRLLRAGKNVEASDRTKYSGVGDLHAKAILKELRDVSDFAVKRGDKFYADARAMNENIKVSLALYLIIIALLILCASYLLMKAIKEPLLELTSAAEQYSRGVLGSRSRYVSANEFGTLSSTFNALAETIQNEMRSKESAAGFAGLMFSEEDPAALCHALLKDLLAHTGSQIGAVYLLNGQKTDFEHFESIGLSASHRVSFSASEYEGEFGAALATRQIQHIRDIPGDTRFSFASVSGTLHPREIMTIPICLDAEITAVVSLASVRNYPDAASRLVNEIHGMLTAHLNGVLAQQKIRVLVEQLKYQNRELETQKTELTSQSAELMSQNAELEMQKKQLDEAGRLKTSFLSNMSHELRTPLNSVIALSGVLNRRLVGKIEEEEYSYLEVIERNAKHLLALINDILDISRIEAGREDIEISKCNANDLVAEVVGMIHVQAREKHIELLHVGSDADIVIACDAGKCRHILQNLIGNAVKFTERGTVTISVRQNGGNIAVAVADTGIGIAGDHLPYIFDEFRQADSSTSRKFGGTGLGLAIAKKYAHLLGGTIAVKSTVGEGSVFTLTLPLLYVPENRIRETVRAAGVKHVIAKVPQQPPSGSSMRTILLVEDNEPAIIQIIDVLEESGYHMLVARDGAEALEIIARTIPDAMILDLMMPGIDGFQVLKTIREAERSAGIPVLILTAKHISKEELQYLSHKNIHQLIQKGDVNRRKLQNAVASMVLPEFAETPKPSRERRTVEGKPVVLAVEDNPDNMITLKALLADKFTVIEAADGTQCVELAKKHKPHLILMDIALTGTDGIQAYTAIRQNRELQHIPVIAVTASAMTQDRETILAHGFDAYIPKPIDERQFFKTINEALYGEWEN